MSNLSAARAPASEPWIDWGKAIAAQCIVWHHLVLLASRGLSDTDHVDGEEPDDGAGHVSIGSAAAAPPGESEEGRQA
mgnify:CR=1 FL=1